MDNTTQNNHRLLTNSNLSIEVIPNSKEGVQNKANQSEHSVSLSALKHDHPIAYDPDARFHGRIGDEPLIASLPPSTLMPSHWCDESEMKHPLCLPYGDCFDDKGFPQNECIESNTLLTQCDMDTVDWLLDGKESAVTEDITSDYWANLHPYSFKIENVFQVDKLDLKSGPTLAQLNSNLTNDIWDSLDLDDVLASAQFDYKKPSIKGQFNYGQKNVIGITSNENEYDSKLQENIDYLTSLLFGTKNSGFENPVSSTFTQSNNISKIDLTGETSPSTNIVIDLPPKTENPKALSHSVNMSEIKPAQEIKQEMKPLESNELTDNSNSNRNRNNSMSTEYSGSSHDEGFASQMDDDDNSDNDDDDLSSDDESFYGDYDASDLLGATTSDDANNKWSLNMGRSRKSGQKRFFWQYNVQSKGPKGTRIASVEDTGDPHVLNEVSDPVFSPDCQVEGVKHSGKARRGDGNDLTPNPKKLLMIGLELKKLSKIINDLTPVAEVPMNARNKTRKEKNKLASRACRLKKKAQHEANKIKLFGLQQEHKKMMLALSEIKRMMRKRVNETENGGPVLILYDQVVKQKGPLFSVAGKTSDFVNSILDNVAAGIANGGLDKI